MEMLTLLHSALLGVFRGSCSKDFPTHNIQHDIITPPLCLNGTSGTSVLVTYRTQLVTMETCSIQQLVESVEQWKTSYNLELGEAGYGGLNLSFTGPLTCPVQIEYLNAPLCMPVSTCDAVMATDQACSCPVSSVMLIACLLVEFVLVTLLYLLLGLVAVYISRRMYVKYHALAIDKICTYHSTMTLGL